MSNKKTASSQKASSASVMLYVAIQTKFYRVRASSLDKSRLVSVTCRSVA
jgi:hypothetical protein